MSAWQPIETADPEDYETVLVLVPTCDGTELTHRIAMYDPEISGWHVFMAVWNPEPIYWMPLPPLHAG